MGNRRHSKVSKLPRELRDAVYEKHLEGHTYQAITDWLKQMGQDISRSAVARDLKDYQANLERVKISREHATAIVAEAGAKGALAMEEAAAVVAVERIMNFLISLPGIEGEEASKVMMALARLQASSVQRERLKMDFKDKAAEAAEAVGKMAKAEGLSDELAEQIKKKILGVAA